MLSTGRTCAFLCLELLSISLSSEQQRVCVCYYANQQSNTDAERGWAEVSGSAAAEVSQGEAVDTPLPPWYKRSYKVSTYPSVGRYED